MVNPKITDLNGTRIVTFDTANVYTIKPFRGLDNKTIFNKLVKYGSKYFGGIIRGVTTADMDADAVSLIIATSLSDSFIDADDPEFIKFIYEEILANVFKGNSPFDFDNEFVGSGIVRTFTLIKEVISYNFSPVFQELGINALFKPKEQTE